LEQRLQVFRENHDAFRRAVITEPRGSEVIVGALLTAPVDPSAAAGVIFFDNVTFLGMCGHGTIGVVTTLAHLGKITPGTHKIETPVGTVTAILHPDGSVSLTNVPSYRTAKDVRLELAEYGTISGHVAWGGNWFFLCETPGLTLTAQNARPLTEQALTLRDAVHAAGFPEVDHIVFLGPPHSPGAHARNFVLCPGLAYDRSPCGTGTSAWLACLAADGRLAENTPYVIESVVGSRFEGRFRCEPKDLGHIIPEITGRAYIMAEGNLLFDSQDPFRSGILD
jgi:4-hydroxyproline epimerase